MQRRWKIQRELKENEKEEWNENANRGKVRVWTTARDDDTRESFNLSLGDEGERRCWERYARERETKA